MTRAQEGRECCYWHTNGGASSLVKRLMKVAVAKSREKEETRWPVWFP